MRRLTSILALTAVLGFSSGVAAQTNSPTGTDLYHVNLESGELTSLGVIGTGQTVVAFAIDTTATSPLTAWGITDAGTVLTFGATSPGAVGSEMTLTGIPDGDWLVGIDQRPATGQLIGLSAWGTVYWIDPATGETWPIGDGIDPTIESELIGFDFNPTVDRIRVDVATTQNLRLNPETGMVGTNPDTGQPTIDGNLVFAEADVSFGETPEVVGAGYTNSVAEADETTLYVIDATTNVLAIQDPPNDGILNTVGPLSVEVTGFTGFDIHPNGDAFLTVPNES